MIDHSSLTLVVEASHNPKVVEFSSFGRPGGICGGAVAGCQRIRRNRY